MRSLKSISTNSISILLPLYSHESVLVSYRFLNEATGPAASSKKVSESILFYYIF